MVFQLLDRAKHHFCWAFGQSLTLHREASKGVDNSTMTFFQVAGHVGAWLSPQSPTIARESFVEALIVRGVASAAAALFPWKVIVFLCAGHNLRTAQRIVLIERRIKEKNRAEIEHRIAFAFAQHAVESLSPARRSASCPTWNIVHCRVQFADLVILSCSLAMAKVRAPRAGRGVLSNSTPTSTVILNIK